MTNVLYILNWYTVYCISVYIWENSELAWSQYTVFPYIYSASCEEFSQHLWGTLVSLCDVLCRFQNTLSFRESELLRFPFTFNSVIIPRFVFILKAQRSHPSVQRVNKACGHTNAIAYVWHNYGFKLCITIWAIFFLTHKAQMTKNRPDTLIANYQQHRRIVRHHNNRIVQLLPRLLTIHLNSTAIEIPLPATRPFFYRRSEPDLNVETVNRNRIRTAVCIGWKPSPGKRLRSPSCSIPHFRILMGTINRLAYANSVRY